MNKKSHYYDCNYLRRMDSVRFIAERIRWAVIVLRVPGLNPSKTPFFSGTFFLFISYHICPFVPISEWKYFTIAKYPKHLT